MRRRPAAEKEEPELLDEDEQETAAANGGGGAPKPRLEHNPLSLLILKDTNVKLFVFSSKIDLLLCD